MKKQKIINSNIENTNKESFENINSQLKIIFSNNNKKFKEKIEPSSLEDIINNIYNKNANTDRKTKSIYAYVLLGMLCFQTIATTAIFVCKGLNILKYSDSTFNIYISGTMIQIVLLVEIIVKYLFTDNLSAIIKNMLDNKKDKH